MKSLVDSKFQGADSEKLKSAMNALAKNPTGAELDKALTQLAEARGRPVSEIKAEYDKFLKIKAQGEANNGPSAPLNQFLHGDFMGSTTQMRYGKVVGDAFGVDPVFGSLLNPPGGLVGPDNVAFDADGSAVGYHGIVHDAAGYLYNAQHTGPGYDYLGREGRDTSDPLSGQRAGIQYWRDTLGSDWKSTVSQGVMDTVVPAVDWVSDKWSKFKSIF